MPENPNCIVTVITTTFNLVKNGRVDFFKQCVESVHSQDYQYIEHLVIDGASSDGSLEIIREYEQKGWLTCISEPDKGIYDAMNKGIRLAKGKYIAFLNSDDFWHDSHGVSESVKALEANQASMSYADRNIITSEGKLMWDERANVGLFLHHMPFCHQTIFTRRDILLKYGGFNAVDFRSAADYDLIMRILLHGESVIYVTRNFTTFRFGGFSATDEALSEQECVKIRETHLSGYSVDRIKDGYISSSLLQHILCRVHSSVANNLLLSYTLVEPDTYRLSTGKVLFDPQNNRVTSLNPVPAFSPKLIDDTPEQKTNTANTYSVYYLFGCIPLIKAAKKNNQTTYYLCSIVPIFMIREKR